ncbi:MAG: family 2A encapsulin nanocompartment cargo protein cysteine desulfurase [Myxococcaceae bacterium]
MSTREPPGTPAEAKAAQGQLPKVTETPANPGNTPGIALASARIGHAPTLPDWDPTTLSLTFAKMANELFSPGVAPTYAASPGLPPMSPQGAVAEAAHPPSVAGAAPPSTLPTSTQATGPTDVNPLLTGEGGRATQGSPGEVTNPFGTQPKFDVLGNPFPVIDLLPVIDGGPHSPLDSAAPYWLMPAASETERPQPKPLTLETYQLEPNTGLNLRPTPGAFDAHALRREFPILEERVNGKRLVWLDNAATTQKPQAVIDRLKYFYEHENSNIHRAAHTLAARATDAYESAREAVRRTLNAPSKNEIVFVRGTTEGINLIAQSWGRRNIEAGDEIIISWLEHHANIVPWQRLCEEKNARLRVAPVDDRGQVILEEYEKLFNAHTRLVAFSQVSNALGTITPAKEMIEIAHRHGATVLLDGAQGISHMRVDVQALDCDFYVFSGHKVFAPTGIGAVYGKSKLLEEMAPWQGGGNMIQDVTFERSLYQGPPAKFEAGTGNIADAVGLGAALDWLARVGVDNIGAWEHELLEYGTERLKEVPGLRMIGTAPQKAGVLSFVLAGQKTEEVGGLLDKEGIAVRSGHHCAQPILRRFGVESSVRASLAPYNTCEDLDALVAALQRLQAGKR